MPFGWVLAEITEEEESNTEAIDGLYAIKVQKAKERVLQTKVKEEAQKKEAEQRAKAKAQKEAKLASMTPAQRLVDSYKDIALLINDMRAGKIEDFENIKKELAKEVKKELQKNPKTWNKAKKKALDRKVYIESLLG
ncbi:hypothetical protein MNB_SV-12-1754 [hydrothermal vent metagenome]|uniref:Uncharacterized protein n=1 Tax=hydrothermal vent metagenome TaxID=652676 RepID=A0A1W1BT47_9ZZZZ